MGEDKKSYPKGYKIWMIVCIIVGACYGVLGIYYIVDLARSAQKSNNGDTGPAATSWISVFMNLFVCAFGILGAISVKKILLKIFFIFNFVMAILSVAQIIFFGVMKAQCNGGKDEEEEGFWDYMCTHIPDSIWPPLCIEAVISILGAVGGFMAMRKSKEKKETNDEGDFF